MKSIILFFVLMGLLFAEIKVGDTFPKLNLVNQYNIPTQIKTKGSFTLILSFEKDVSSKVKKYLDTKEKGFLEANSMMYISDISKMPSLITRMFALPKMKKFSFQVSLIYDEKEAASIPRHKNQVTVIELQNNQIKKIDFAKGGSLESLLK